VKKAAKPKARKRVQTRLVDKKPAFLAAFVACANLTRAAELVGIDRGQHYEWLKADPEYKKAYAEAILQAGDTIRDAIADWGLIGVFEPNVFQGRFVYATRKRTLHTLENGEEIDAETLKALETRFGTPVTVVSSREVEEEYGPPLGIYRRSEGLLARLAKAFLPQQFGDKLSAELSGPGGTPLEIVAKLNAARARLQKARGDDKS
jgi:hypothetical protein